jgi:hypothetical protein
MLEELVDNLKTYAYYRELILTNQARGHTILIETKDGEYKVVPHFWLTEKCMNHWEEIERITIFYKVPQPRHSFKKPEWIEYEFVASAGLDD